MNTTRNMPEAANRNEIAIKAAKQKLAQFVSTERTIAAIKIAATIKG